MEKHKKKVLVLIGVILVFISLIAIILGIIYKEEKKESKPPTIPNNSSTKISKDIEELRDKDVFFALQNAINNYYDLLINKDSNMLLKILDKNYINENNINSNNLYNIIKSDYEVVSFVAKSIYYNPNSSITYYFINGYMSDTSMMEDSFNYLNSVNFMIVVDRDNNYEISLLDDDIVLENYAKNYNIIWKDITSNTKLVSYNMSEKNKLVMYINEFLNLMFFDTNRAYNMLDDNTKNKYNDYQDFKNQRIDIYNKYSTNIFAYSTKESNGEIVYQIIDDKQNSLVIYEKNIMNYKIGY